MRPLKYAHTYADPAADSHNEILENYIIHHLELVRLCEEKFLI